MGSRKPGGTPGASEYSHGPGMHPNPKTNYDRMDQPSGPANRLKSVSGGTRQEMVRDMQAYRRLDSAVKGERLEDMYTAEGNTDRFGAGPPLVQTPVERSGKTPDRTKPPRMQRKG